MRTRGDRGTRRIMPNVPNVLLLLKFAMMHDLAA